MRVPLLNQAVSLALVLGLGVATASAVAHEPFTRVTNGAVVVRDLTRGRSVVVRAGHSYLAPRPHRARRRH